MLGCFLNRCNPIANQPIKKQLKLKIHHTFLHSFIPLIPSNSLFTSSSPKFQSHGQKLQTFEGVFSTKACKGSIFLLLLHPPTSYGYKGSREDSRASSSLSKSS